MATYCFKCRLCGGTQMWSSSDPVVYCPGCEQFNCVVRDYKAEAVGIDTSNLRSAR